MTFFLALPAILIVVLLGDLVVHKVTHEFIDLQDLVRRLVLVTLLWASIGWLLEARAGIVVADTARWCMETATREIEGYKARVWELLGVGL